MSVLEFVQVLVSIILALGIAELLKGWADFLRAESSRPSVLLFALGCWLVLQHIQFWWVGWRFRDVTTWVFPELLLYVTGPIVLYLAARLLFPQVVVDGADLGKYYARHGPKVWSLIAAFFVVAILVNTVLLDAPLFSSGPISQAGLILVSLFVRRSPRPWVHATAIVLLLLQLSWRTTLDVVSAG